jgi:hypothetical protein
MGCKARGDGHTTVADNRKTIWKAVPIVATIVVAAPLLAEDTEMESASEIGDYEVAQSSGGAPPYTGIESQASKSQSLNFKAWSPLGWDGRFALGAGMTYQYDGSRGTDLAFASWSTRDDHYELAAFRFLSPQMRLGCPLAGPNWVFEASRRWRLHWKLIDHSGMELFFGMGAAYKTKTDDLNGSNLNFAEQLGWRFPQQDQGGRVEFAIRHLSNAGLKKPNRGEDFLTLAYLF